MSKLAVIVLAAGEASRFGSPKQLAEIDGKPLLSYVMDMAAKLDGQFLLCLGAHREAIKARLPLNSENILEVDNWEAGQGASIKAAIRKLQSTPRWKSIDRLLILLGDQPFVPLEHCIGLSKCAERNQLESIVCTQYDKADESSVVLGVPAVFPRSFVERILTIPDEKGAKVLFKRFKPLSLKLSADHWLDVDTVEDLEKAKEVCQKQSGEFLS